MGSCMHMISPCPTHLKHLLQSTLGIDECPLIQSAIHLARCGCWNASCFVLALLICSCVLAQRSHGLSVCLHAFLGNVNKLASSTDGPCANSRVCLLPLKL